jgi:hypothetical protein
MAEALPSAVLYGWRGSLAPPDATVRCSSSLPVWRLMLQLSLPHLLSFGGPAGYASEIADLSGDTPVARFA